MTDLTIASQGFSYASFESAAMTRLIEDTAHAWLRSFGLTNASAKQRLVTALRDALAQDSFAANDRTNMQDLLDQAAHDTIGGWFAQVTGQHDCYGSGKFSMLRCAFLSANRDGIWSEHFLDQARTHHDLAIALSVQMMLPTPSLKSCEMPRQTLERRAS
ncbi:hypothetical protein [Thalassospira lucentensis]|jgi:hypothetical protein|uniref:hypothetical protein n=1 Tax=Thalassospira lucentensis TaxID=168935 RepID=UPI003AA892A5|tara:strand:+ start:837 stop:1316 length:480 start_codon:yes stop_codon:yes gene_type:complete